MSRPTVIDADGHVQEKYIRWEDYLEEPYRSQAPRVVKDNSGVDFLMVEGKLWPKPSGPGVGNVGAGYSRRPQATTGMADPVQRIKDMDLEGIDTAVLFGTNVFLSLAYYEDADNACALARAYNDWLAEYCSQDRDRLKGVALVPIQEPLEAAKEPRRCVTELGFVAVGTPAHSTAGGNLDNPALRPFFAAAEELDVPVCIHVGAGRPAAGTERSTNAFFNHVITHPFEQMIGALCIVAGGILEEFPRLRVAFLEAGAGWVPYWIERMDEHYEYMQPAVPWLKKTPGEYMRSEQVFYSFEPDEQTLPFVLDFVGHDRLVFASDYNHGDCKFPHTVSSMLERKDLPEGAMNRIMNENARRLYRL